MLKHYCPKLAKFSIILAIAFLFVSSVKTYAGSFATVNFQGKIVRNDTGYEGLNVTDGTPACVVSGSANDTCDFQVKYYTASSGGTLLLTEVFSNIEIGQYNGAFNLSLGSDVAPTSGTYVSCDGGTCDSLEEVVNAVNDLYIEVGFAPGGSGSFTETFSRMPIQAAAYALKSRYAFGADTAFQFDTATDDSGYTSPDQGMVYYDTTDNVLKVYDGAAWNDVGGGTGSLFTDGGIFTYLTSLTDHFVLGSSSYSAIGTSNYATYLAGLSSNAPFSFDMGAERLTLTGSQSRSGLSVYSDYNSTGAWPLVSFKAEDASFDNNVLEVVQDGTGNILSLQKGSTEAFVFENPLTFYIHQRATAPTTYVDRLYNLNGTLYWNGNAINTGTGSLWTDGGTFTYLTSTTDDVIIGGDSESNAKFFFDVSTGNLGIGTSTPAAKLDIAGSSSTISNSTGDITLLADDTVVIKANDTEADNLMEWQNSSGTILSLVNQSGYATFGSGTGNTGAILSVGANTSSVAQINLASSAGTDVSSPSNGDLWYNGTNLYFYDGSDNIDLLVGGSGGGLYSNTGSVASGSYLNVNHAENTYELTSSGWICVGGSNNASCSGGNWMDIKDTDITIAQSLSNQWNDADSDGVIRSTIKLTDVELSAGMDIGTGADGDITVSTSTNINTTSLISGRSCADGGDAVNYSVTSFAGGGTTATLSTTPSTGCLAVNDEVLIINLQGTSSAYPNVGNYETLRIASVSGTTVTFKTAKTKYYGDASTDDSNIGTGTGTQKVMLQRVPNYNDVTVNSSYTLSPTAWNGVKGGVVFFRANGTVSISGSISASSAGYRYGAGQTVSGSTNGTQGESLAGTGTTAITANYTGGGAGKGDPCSGGSYGGGGGGGSFVGAGTMDQYSQASAGNIQSTYFGSFSTLDRLAFGGGGGGGGADNNISGGRAGNGGSGGGIVFISGNSVTVSGSIVSSGGAGSALDTYGGGGAGGAGGSIFIKGVTVVLGSSIITANGGAGGNSSGGGDGGSGGTGRIDVYYGGSVTGATSPTYTSYTLGYYNYGLYTSPVISTPSAQSYSNLRWESTLNTYGKISVQTRTGSTADSTDGTWESWKPYTSGTDYTLLQSSDTHTDWTGTNATISDGDVTRNVDFFEDEDESTAGNITKMVSSTNGGYAESTISSTDISGYDYISFWVRASQTGNVLRIGIGESAGTEQYENITIDAANTWQKVHWDLSDITGTSRDAITKIRLTNYSTTSNTIYIDNVRAEKLLTITSGAVITSTPNDYIQYRIIFTTTNLSYQPQLENISFSYNYGYRIVIYDSNNVRLYNYTDSTRYLKLDVGTSGGTGGSGNGFVNGIATSTIADGAGAVAFTFDTSSTFSNPTSKLLSVLNNGTEAMYLDSDGNLYVSGSVIAGKGLGTALVNNSGGTVAQRGLVMLDSTTNNAFTTTTTPDQTGAFGVVQGVDVNNDTDGDGNCDNGDTCLVVFEGLVDVNIKSATSATKGDYIYSSDTAAQGYADSGDQNDGLIGIVASTAGASSGYVGMVFNAQNKVTADTYLNIGFDKNAYRDIYHQLADAYNSLTEAERAGLIESGDSQSVMFDNMVDGLKIDSTNSTVGLDTVDSKAGLWGGLNITGSTTDLSSMSYLGNSSATLETSYYYDRSQTGLSKQDSTPDVMVDLGLDPYWYDGVSLITSCTTNCKKNSNLSSLYNGSLFKVNGAYGTGSEHGYIDIKIVGITTTGLTANITSSDGTCSATGASLTYGSEYSFVSGSCSGSSITINPTRADYKSGDTFRISSWYIEPSGSDRGSKQSFPQRALILGSKVASTAIYVTIIDADTQKVWMSFNSGTSSYTASNILVANTTYTVDTIFMLDGQLMIGSDGGASDVGNSTVDFVKDKATSLSTAGRYKYNSYIGNRNSGSGYTLNSSVTIISNEVNDIHAAVVPNKATETATYSGWGVISTPGGASVYSSTFMFPVVFNNIPNVTVTLAGYTTAGMPTSLEDCTSIYSNGFIASSITTSSAKVNVSYSSNFGASGEYRCYTWKATGEVSPSLVSAYATEEGATVIDYSSKNTGSGDFYSASDDNYNQVFVDSLRNIIWYGWDYSADTQLRVWGFTYGSAISGSAFTNKYAAVRLESANTNPNFTGATNPVFTELYVDEANGNMYLSNPDGVYEIGGEFTLDYAPLAVSADICSYHPNLYIKTITSNYSSEMMYNDPRGMWPLNYDNSSADNEDVSSLGNDLTGNNVTAADAVTGVRGKGVDLNGTDEYLYRATDSDFDMGSQLSISAWIKTSQTSGSGYILNRYGAASGGAGSTNALYKLVMVNGIMTLTVRDNTDATLQTLTGIANVADGTWHHVVGVIDKTHTLLSIYVDGQLDNSVTMTETGTYTFDDALYIGVQLESGGAYSGYFSGVIDEVTLSANAYTQSMIKAMYSSGLRALNGSHSSSDAYNTISGSSDVRSLLVDRNSRYMYIGTEGSGITKYDITSDTNVQTMTTTSDPSISTNNAETISGLNYPIFVGDNGTSGTLTGVDGNGNNSSGTYYSLPVSFDTTSDKAYLWMHAYKDSLDVSSSFSVYASNDNGASYVLGYLVKTNTAGDIPEYEYSFDFSVPGSTYIVKIVLNRASSNKASVYIADWALAQMGIPEATTTGMYTEQNDTVASGSYLELIHGQNTYNIVATGWVFDTTLSKWVEISNTDTTILHNSTKQWADADPDGIIRTQVNTSDISLLTYPYGIYTSPVIPTPNAQSYDNLRWTSTLNTYGKISVQTRTGSTTDSTDGSWEAWKPSTATTNYLTLESADTHTNWTGTNATVAEGDVTRNVDFFEDEDEATATNLTKVTSSTNGGYAESTISSTNLSSYDYITLWVRASQTGAVLRIGMGESAGSEQYEDITIDTTGTWQKVYWDISDITSTSRDAITKLRITNLTGTSNTIYFDNVRAEDLFTTSDGVTITSTASSYIQYRVIFTTTNTSNLPQLETISFVYKNGYEIKQIDANTVRLYNNTNQTQKLRLDIALGVPISDTTVVNIAPTSAQVDGGNNTNSIWINKMGTGGNLLKLQTNSVDMLVVNSTGDMTLGGDMSVIGGTLTLGDTGDQGTIRYNATNNEIEFSNDGTKWLPLGDITRNITLSAEYAGAVLSGDGSNNTGTMTSDNTGSSSNSMNYYEWSSSEVSLNDYDVRVRFTLPSDFNGWGTSGNVVFNFATESTSSSNNKLDTYIYREDSSNIDGTSTNNVSSVAGTWTTATIAGTDLNECASAGNVCVLILRMSSLSDNYVRIGDIDITYDRSL